MYYSQYKARILSTYDGLEVYAGPYSFNPNLSWYPNGFFYQDVEAIYVGSSVAIANPEWIIRDANGNPLYIPYGCANGTCAAYMADLGNPEFRAYWISQAQQTMAIGYTAIFIDDASMTIRASDGYGNPAAMIDPRTGNVVTPTLWQQWNVTFFQQIRAAFPAPQYRIMQNVVWYADTDQSTRNPLIDHLDYFYLEFGINDPGITGGDGQFSMQKELDMLMRVKTDGANFGLAGVSADEPGEELAFAFAMLATDGNDFLGDDNQVPTNPITCTAPTSARRSAHIISPARVFTGATFKMAPSSSIPGSQPGHGEHAGLFRYAGRSKFLHAGCKGGEVAVWNADMRAVDVHGRHGTGHRRRAGQFIPGDVQLRSHGRQHHPARGRLCVHVSKLFWQ
jgi:hypothetical protein